MRWRWRERDRMSSDGVRVREIEREKVKTKKSKRENAGKRGKDCAMGKRRDQLRRSISSADQSV